MFSKCKYLGFVILGHVLACIVDVNGERKLPSIWGDVMSVEQWENGTATDFEPTGYYWVLAEVQIVETGKVSQTSLMERSKKLHSFLTQFDRLTC